VLSQRESANKARVTALERAKAQKAATELKKKLKIELKLKIICFVIF